MELETDRFGPTGTTPDTTPIKQHTDDPARPGYLHGFHPPGQVGCIAMTADSTTMQVKEGHQQIIEGQQEAIEDQQEDSTPLTDESEIVVEVTPTKLDTEDVILTIDDVLAANKDTDFDWKTENTAILQKMSRREIVVSTRKAQFYSVCNPIAKYKVGLRWLTEFQPGAGATTPPWYLCHVCREKITSDNIADHVISLRHRILTMKRHDHHIYEKIQPMTFTSMTSLRWKVMDHSRKLAKRETSCCPLVMTEMTTEHEKSLITTTQILTQMVRYKALCFTTTTKSAIKGANLGQPQKQSSAVTATEEETIDLTTADETTTGETASEESTIGKTTIPGQTTTTDKTTVPGQKTTAGKTTIPGQTTTGKAIIAGQTTTTDKTTITGQTTTTDETTIPGQTTTTDKTTIPGQTTTDKTTIPGQTTTTGETTITGQTTNTDETTIPGQTTTTGKTTITGQTTTTTTDKATITGQTTTTYKTTIPGQTTTTTDKTTIPGQTTTTTDKTTIPGQSTTTTDKITIPGQTTTTGETTMPGKTTGKTIKPEQKTTGKTTMSRESTTGKTTMLGESTTGNTTTGEIANCKTTIPEQTTTTDKTVMPDRETTTGKTTTTDKTTTPGQTKETGKTTMPEEIPGQTTTGKTTTTSKKRWTTSRKRSAKATKLSLMKTTGCGTYLRKLKDIELGKTTPQYQDYIRMVPKYQRDRTHPRTPDPTATCSRRSWDAQIRIWRKRLHFYKDRTGDTGCAAVMGSRTSAYQPNPAASTFDTRFNERNDNFNCSSPQQRDDFAIQQLFVPAYTGTAFDNTMYDTVDNNMHDTFDNAMHDTFDNAMNNAYIYGNSDNAMAGISDNAMCDNSAGISDNVMYGDSYNPMVDNLDNAMYSTPDNAMAGNPNDAMAGNIDGVAGVHSYVTRHRETFQHPPWGEGIADVPPEHSAQQQLPNQNIGLDLRQHSSSQYQTHSQGQSIPPSVPFSGLYPQNTQLWGAPAMGFQTEDHIEKQTGINQTARIKKAKGFQTEYHIEKQTGINQTESTEINKAKSRSALYAQRKQLRKHKRRHIKRRRKQNALLEARKNISDKQCDRKVSSKQYDDQSNANHTQPSILITVTNTEASGYNDTDRCNKDGGNMNVNDEETMDVSESEELDSDFDAIIAARMGGDFITVDELYNELSGDED